MRRNFAQILKSGKVDYKKEYKKLYELLFITKVKNVRGISSTLHEIFAQSFIWFYFRGICLSLKEFDEKYGFIFPGPESEDLKMDDLILLMEYFYNMLQGYNFAYAPNDDTRISTDALMSHIIQVCESIGYKKESEDDFTIFVEENTVATAVAESDLIPDDLSYKLITYDHHSMRGNLEAKKAILIRLAGILEGQEQKLLRVNSSFKKDLFYIFNNFNIRHNNCNSQYKDYKPVIANMDKQELENWYDETYQMCLLAFMELEQADRKPKFDAIKAKIEKK